MASRGITPTDIQQAIAQAEPAVRRGLARPVAHRAARRDHRPGRRPKAASTSPRSSRTSSCAPTRHGAAIVRLGDVGRAEEGAAELHAAAEPERQAGGVHRRLPAAGLQRSARSPQGVRTTLENLKAGFPEGIDYEIVARHHQVRHRLHRRGGAHARRGRGARGAGGVPVPAEPARRRSSRPSPSSVSIVGTFVGMALLGFSINLLTLFGMVLAIGIVVDDAIVVIETVEAQHEDARALGPRRRDSPPCRKCRARSWRSCWCWRRCSCPTAFLGGTTGVLYKQFAITVVISVVLSGFVALTLTPALAALLLDGSHGQPPKILQKFNEWFDRLTERYRPACAGCSGARRWRSRCSRPSSSRSSGSSGPCRAASCRPRTRASCWSRPSCPTPRASTAPRRSDRRIGEIVLEHPGGKVRLGAHRLQHPRRPVQDQRRDGVREPQGLRGAQGRGTVARRGDREHPSEARRHPGRHRHPGQPAAHPGSRHAGRLRVVDPGSHGRRPRAPRAGGAAAGRRDQATAELAGRQLDIQPGLARS